MVGTKHGKVHKSLPSSTLPSSRKSASPLPEPDSGQMLLRTIYLSLDPYMRGRMNAGPSYAKPVEVGEVMEGRAVCEVVKSNLPTVKYSRPSDENASACAVGPS